MLYSISKHTSNKIFLLKQIKGLPEPVQRYFRCSLKEGQQYVRYVKLKHSGKFRQYENQKWMPIEGEEYFTTERPGFIWIGKISLLPFVWITGIDKYMDGEGTFQIKLMSLLTIANAPGGRELNEAELMRWLGEAPLFPTALLPNDYLQWEAVNSISAKALVNYAGVNIELLFHFNEKGEISQVTGIRYRTIDDIYVKEKWMGQYSKYAKANNMMVPWELEVSWNTESSNFSYAKFKVTEIQYDDHVKY